MRLPFVACLLAAIATTALADDVPPEPKPATSAWHIGAMTPLVTRVRGKTITPTDSLMTMVPFGVLVMRGPLMFDAELMPMVTTGPQTVDLTLAPGFIYAATPRVWVGGRTAFEVRSGKVGLTPMVHVNLLAFQENRFFTELAVPVRLGEDTGGRFMTAGFAIALGVVFM